MILSHYHIHIALLQAKLFRTIGVVERKLKTSATDCQICFIVFPEARAISIFGRRERRTLLLVRGGLLAKISKHSRD